MLIHARVTSVHISYGKRFMDFLILIFCKLVYLFVFYLLGGFCLDLTQRFCINCFEPLDDKYDISGFLKCVLWMCCGERGQLVGIQSPGINLNAFPGPTTAAALQ